jgi:hypothetical protein
MIRTRLNSTIGPGKNRCRCTALSSKRAPSCLIQQDGPSVRLILTDHGLDRMFWKGKGAFILGCTSPLNSIVIDRPVMGKVKN